MYERYTSSAMADTWSAARQYARWRSVELEVLRARVSLGELPAEVAAAASSALLPSPAEVSATEATTRHDVVAFLDVWTSGMSPEVAGWVHRDLTSSDVVDTGLAIALDETTDVLDMAGSALVGALRDHALRHRTTVRLGRTHGRGAEADVWGHRVADFALAVSRCRDRLRQARAEAALVKISGPVGRYSRLDRRIEEIVASRLNLRAAPVTTQVVMRDSLAMWMGAVAVLSSVTEAIALEVRHGQREEVAEIFEPHGAGQVGSSSMPHKRNPVTSEQVCGLARVVRSLVLPVTEGIALWHERDISHSSVERVCVPQAAALTEHQLIEMARVISGLEVDEGRMLRNLRGAGATVVSSELLTLLVQQGLPRTDAQDLLRPPPDADPAMYEKTVRERAARAGLHLPAGDLVTLAVDRVQRSDALDVVFEQVASL
ncbi:MAG: adenylosuccinate lyase [Actinomycetota bacterium]|nr:adenylosuccinate lyase [Actinomycetota bacterium]